MKKHLYILLIALCASLFGATQVQAQNPIFQKYSDMDNDDVEYVCITRSMLRMLSNNNSKKKIMVNGVNINGISDAVKVLLIINSGDPSVCSLMKEDFKTLKADPNYEMLMMIKDGMDKVITLYNQKKSDKELVMYIDDGIDQTFIVLTGDLTEDMVNKILAK